MIVALDASVLVFLFEKDAKAPINPETGKPLERCYDRVNHLIAELAASSAKIVIPTPALAEVLVMAGEAAPEWLNTIGKSRHFVVADFDVRAAIEHSAQMSSAPRPLAQGKQKAKFDYQIIAIARVAGAEAIYSFDSDVAKDAGPGLKVYGGFDLPLPPEDQQGDLFRP
ncbi:hypothetical protein GIY56_06060 [Paracoccus sp. YIM 132242]|uniref:PIN domain-containing protein n=1 Tax=Paracoccus lichenicola TaxID=2665644 RepID=A0A6L6HL08_9RHOB|nr:hypothetical protein [Paracoccus lichenicola]MTD99843.1 hypothetical protein [Paracoccus lichenicola]